VCVGDQENKYEENQECREVLGAYVRCVEVRYLFSSAICVFGDFVMLASGFYSLGSRHISSLVLWVLSWCARGMLVGVRGKFVGARGFLFPRSVLVLFSFCSCSVLILFSCLYLCCSCSVLVLFSCLYLSKLSSLSRENKLLSRWRPIGSYSRFDRVGDVRVVGF
jgi:hypothetical protein